MEFVVWLLGRLLLGLAEVAITAAGEFLFDMGLRLFGRSLLHRTKPILQFLSFGIVGAIAGAISLIFFPEAFASSPFSKAAFLGVVPVLAGLTMSWFGRQRRRSGRPTTQLNDFGAAFVFAFALNLVRFFGSR